MAIPFVGRRFNAESFAEYLADVQFSSFQPIGVTLHHTAAPSLAQRPKGFTDVHLKNLLSYYQNTMKWSGAPHVFVDDQPDGIIVFQRMDRRGVHAVTFNRRYWGIEMLGYYDKEPFHTGRGAVVRDHAMQALAAMLKRLGKEASSETITFHRDDPKTTKSCPGRLVEKAYVVSAVSALMKQPLPKDQDETDAWNDWTVKLPDGSGFEPVHVHDGRPIVPIRAFIDALGRSGGSFKLDATRTHVLWTPPGMAEAKIPMAELDESGKSWSYVRSIAEAAGHTIAVAGREVSVKKA